MDEFISYVQMERTFSSVKELQGILKHCHENISGKAYFLMRIFAIFCYFQTKSQSEQLQSDSFMNHSTCSTYKAVSSCEFSNTIWKNDIRKIPNFDFFQLNQYFVVINEKYNGDLLRRAFYKRLKSFKFFYEGHIKTKMELCTTIELFMFILEQNLQWETNVIMLLQIYEKMLLLLLVLVSLDQVSSVLGNAIIMLVLFFLPWKILIEKT